MRIWIDIDRTCGISFLKPIIERLKSEGHEVAVTARDFAQTCEMLDMHGIPFMVIGKHAGRNVVKKVMSNLARMRKLYWFGLKNKPDVSISHGSRALAPASWLLGIPNIVTFDYEYIYKTPFFMFSKKIAIPECIPEEVLREEGFPMDRVVRYPGIKEEVSLYGFSPNGNIPLGMGGGEGVTALFRSPATMAHYHNERTDVLFKATLAHLVRNNVRVFLSLRSEKQRESIPQSKDIIILDKAYDGPSMIYHCDLVVGGGGSMNREAALLGTPCYSIFASAKGAVDKMLEREGKLVFINSIEDVNKITIMKKKRSPVNLNNPSLVNFFINLIESEGENPYIS